jgi:uncharacterized protein (TIGR04255 family)
VLYTGMIFSNPPLVELVAELRWVPGVSGASVPPSGPINIQFPIASMEESFEKFRQSVATKGFAVSERLVPPGFPTLPFSVAQRFRKPSSAENYVYQIGMGVFSANALPPYRSWDSFRPIVNEGVETLLASRHSSDNGNISVILRYLDVFSDDLTEGLKSFDFLNSVLGIRLTLPPVLMDQVESHQELRAGIQLAFPLKDGLSMNIGFQDATVAGKTGLLMTTEVFTINPVNAELGKIMQNFDKAHDYIRVTFVGLTKKIHDKMKPVEAK